MKVPHLMSIRPMECWLAMLNVTVQTLIVLCASNNCGKNTPFCAPILDSSTDLAPKMKASQFGRQRTAGAFLNGSANLTAKKSLGRTNQVPGSKKFCTAWNWRLALDAQTLQVDWQWLSTLSTDLGRSSVLWCFTKRHSYLRPSHWKAIISAPESLRQWKLRNSRMPQVPWLRHMQGTWDKHAAMFLSVCVRQVSQWICSYLSLFHVDASLYWLNVWDVIQLGSMHMRSLLDTRSCFAMRDMRTISWPCTILLQQEIKWMVSGCWKSMITQVSLVIKPPGLKTLGTRTMCAVALVVLGQVFLRRADHSETLPACDNDSQCKTKHTGCWSFWNQRQGWGCLRSFDAQIECLEVRSSATREIEDWHWAQTLQVYWQWLSTVNTASGRSSELWCFKKHLSHLPFTLKGHNLCSRMVETTEIETCLKCLGCAAREGKTRKTCRHNPCFCLWSSVCVCVCVCLHVCNTMVSLHMKIWERFCLKLKSRISNCS